MPRRLFIITEKDTLQLSKKWSIKFHEKIRRFVDSDSWKTCDELVNSKGEWRIVLNYLKAKNDFIAQTVRIELCDHPGEKCPKIPGKKIYFGKFILEKILQTQMFAPCATFPSFYSMTTSHWDFCPKFLSNC